ncbi:copper resistance CopC family protein [Plantactinospora sonchi]|uniref:Copper resistance CopC family protein n=1 Tax=Plantactinospora sonchi TaxID=1544735 RepID=A0ABU7RZ59_9ACTN
MRRRAVTLAMLGVGAVLAVLSAAVPALAHARLTASDPKADSTVTRALTQVTLTFSELVRGNLSTVVITGPGGSRYSTGKPQVVDRQVRQPVASLPSGDYRVAYRMVSTDGHPIEGQFRFTLALPPGQEPRTAPPTPPPTTTAPTTTATDSTAAAVPAASSDSGSGTGQWWAAGVAGAGVIAVGVVVRLRRRRAGTR